MGDRTMACDVCGAVFRLAPGKIGIACCPCPDARPAVTPTSAMLDALRCLHGTGEPHRGGDVSEVRQDANQAAAALSEALDLLGVDVVAEYERRCEECPTCRGDDLGPW